MDAILPTKGFCFSIHGTLVGATFCSNHNPDARIECVLKAEQNGFFPHKEGRLVAVEIREVT
jgi:hypothetical protein